MATDVTSYFALLPSNELAGDLEGKMTDWVNFTQKSGLKAKWERCYRAYFGRHWKGSTNYLDSEILPMGEDGELQGLTVNDYRNLIKHMLVLTTNQRPAFDPRATNTDEKSITQTRLASNILDYYTRDKRLSRYLHSAAEQALVFGKGFLYITWDKGAGRPYTVGQIPDEDGNPKDRIIYEGDVRIRNLDVTAVFNDQSTESWNDLQWVLVREWVNKFDLAARRPDLASQIVNLPTKNEITGLYYLTFQRIEETSLIPMYSFYHLKSDALPNGRFCQFLNNETILFDGPIPYNKLPVFRIVPGDYWGSTEGYSDFFDLLNLQQAENVVWSTLYTNIQAFGVQNVLIPEGANLTAIQIGKALNALKYNPAAGEIRPLQLTQSPPEAYKFLEMLAQKMEIISGMNSVARGAPQEQDMSGKALGLLQSMSIQFASGFQESYAELSEDAGTFILHLLKDFAKTERMMAITGKFNQSQLVKFTGQDLSEIDRVVVDLGNPMSKTLFGRMDIAKELLGNGLIKNAQEYISLIETGNLNVMTEGAEAHLTLVRDENEALQEGAGGVQAALFDKHVLHLQEHWALISKTDTRSNSPIFGQVMNHIQEHINMMRQIAGDPQLAMIVSMVTGEPPYPPPPPPPPPPGALPPGAHPPGPPHKPPMPHRPPMHPVPGKHGPLQPRPMPPGPQAGMGMPNPRVPGPMAPPGPQEAMAQALKP